MLRGRSRGRKFWPRGRSPSGICDDVIILHPLIDCHGPNIVRNFHVDWFGVFLPVRASHCAIVDRQTDRQVDVAVTESPLHSSWGGGLARQDFDATLAMATVLHYDSLADMQGRRRFQLSTVTDAWLAGFWPIISLLTSGHFYHVAEAAVVGAPGVRFVLCRRCLLGAVEARLWRFRN